MDWIQLSQDIFRFEAAETVTNNEQKCGIC